MTLSCYVRAAQAGVRLLKIGGVDNIYLKGVCVTGSTQGVCTHTHQV